MIAAVAFGADYIDRKPRILAAAPARARTAKLSKPVPGMGPGAGTFVVVMLLKSYQSGKIEGGCEIVSEIVWPADPT